MEIIFQAHHATISERMRTRAERAVQKTAQRLQRPVDAIVRFEEDGPTRRVEIVLRAPRHRNLVAEGCARYYGPALAEAVERLQAQIPKKRAVRVRGTRSPNGRARSQLAVEGV